MPDINFKDWDKNRNILVHPFYNDGYQRYDLSINDIIEGLKKAGYDLDGEDEGKWWENDDLSKVINYRLEIISSNGSVINNENYSTTLSVRLYINNKDVTNTIPAINFKWSRISGNTEKSKIEDAEWNLRFADGAKEILVTKNDINKRALFQCQFVKYNDEIEWVKNAYTTYVNLINKGSEK